MTARRHLDIDRPSPRMRGVERGRQLRDRLPTAIDLYLRLFRAVGVGEPAARDGALVAMDAVAAWRPGYLEEIEGVASGAGAEPWHVMALNARTEILALAPDPVPGECSTIVCVPAGGAPVGIQTWDWHEELDPFWHTHTVRGTQHSFVGMTEYGVLSKIGVNSAGLGLFFNILGHRDDAPGGIPVHVLSAAVLGECATVDEALDLLRAAPIGTSGALTLLDTQTAACAELSPGRVAELRPERGFLVHTNHFLDPVNAAGEKSSLYQPDSGQRYALIGSRLPCHPETAADRDTMVGWLRSAPGEAKLCCRPEPGARFGERWATLATVELDTLARNARVLPGTPLESDAVPWTDLTAPAAAYPGGSR